VTQGGSNLAAGVREGDVLAGKYRVEKVLGVGGMGVVVAAHHLQLDEKVALKFLLPHMLTNGEAVARFAREARAAVKIKSEHVARVIDVGTLETGAPYMVMEFLEGLDLGMWLQQRGALAFEQAVEFVLQACVAVAEAHALGIVHRDLKPANLFCIRRADGQLSIKVLDFGISKTTTAAGSSAPEMSMTATSAMMGSPLYMSPEQMESAKNVDRRTDIWALGVILYELLARKTPFDGDSMPAVCMKISAHRPPPLSTYRPDAPPGLEGVILRCLEKNREQRFPNVAELGLALLPFAPKRAKSSVERISGIIQSAGLSATALSVPPSPDAVTAPPPVGTMAPFGVTTTGRSRGKMAAGVVGAIAVLCVAAAAFISMRHSGNVSEAGTDKPPVAAGQLPPPVPTPQAVPPSSPAATELPAAPMALTPRVATAATTASTAFKAAPARPVATTKSTATTSTTAVVTQATAVVIAPPPPAPKPTPSNPANVDPLANLQPKK
jgi:serine/threonine-protein kinase